MVNITDDYLKNKAEFVAAGIKVPSYDDKQIAQNTLANPRWVHFGGGNLFRAFHAAIASHLIDQGKMDSGIIVSDAYDDGTINGVYRPYNNRILRVVTKADGTKDLELFASVAKAVFSGRAKEDPSGLNEMKAVFAKDSLQVVSFSITEKGYVIKTPDGKYLPAVERDLANGPEAPENTMAMIASMLLSRYQNGAKPVAMLSTDNFSQNGDRLKESVLTIAKGWLANDFVDQGFIDWLADDTKVSFPLSMIDRITPNPSETVEKDLKVLGIEGVDIVHTKKHTNIAAFANTEEAHYLVIEDKFPNGRPAFEAAGVIMTDRDTVNLADEMKVTVCLNPLHTALAIYGSVLGFKSIATEVKDPDLNSLIKQIGYVEGLPVVRDPKVINPKAFIDELVQKRLPNPYIPDTPQRIATDTSQKLGIRYGVTIQHYLDDPDREPSQLNFIPLVIATWLRYLMTIDDNGEAFVPSPDPLWDSLHAQVADLKLGNADQNVHDNIKGILSNKAIFGNDLYAIGLGDKIEADFKEMLAGKGAIRQTLEEKLAKYGKNVE
ncbi:MAG: mannitol dehydrogenase family protein [Lactobacillus sp.]|nr:mannitol dehydrogenase family protein [Lactobacillus sp.]